MYSPRVGVIAVLKGMYSPRVDLSELKKRTGAMTVLRGLASVLHITQPKVGSIRLKEKNRCHGCTKRNVQYSVLHTTQPKVGSIRDKEKNRYHGCTGRNVQCTAHHTAKGWIY